MKNILYASDLDRTIIFSKRFLDEHKTNSDYTLVESIGDREISYASVDVLNKLYQLSFKDNITFVPVTSRSKDEYNRIDLGFTPEYAIVANGGIIIHNGVELDDYNRYIYNNMNTMEMLSIMQDVAEMESVTDNVKCIDKRYIFTKIVDKALFDVEIQEIGTKYSNWDITVQGNKVYIIPKFFSKQIALRWLWHKLNQPYIIASGDGPLDIPMLSLANMAIVPDHAIIIQEKYVESCTKSTGGIDSPLFTIDRVLEEARS